MSRPQRKARNTKRDILKGKKGKKSLKPKRQEESYQHEENSDD